MTSRIAAIVDIYDALTADRVYKKAMHPFDALEILDKESDSGLDSELLNTFKNALGVYPVSSRVLLANGSTARVVEQNRETPDRPIIEILYDRNGITPDKATLVNTDTCMDAEYGITGIIREQSNTLA